MTTKPHDDRDPRAHLRDHLLADAGEPTGPEDDGLLVAALDRLDAGERAALVDELLVDRLLAEIHGPRARTVEERVARALADLDRERRARARHARRSHRRWLQTVTGVAAVLILAITLVWVSVLSEGPHDATALAVVERAAAAAADPLDRHYTVDLELVARAQSPPRADLWVRGADHLAVRSETPAGDLWFGMDGTTAWFVPPMEARPVIVSRDLDRVWAFLERAHVSGEFLEISSVLENMREHYTVELLPPALQGPLDAPETSAPRVRVRGVLADDPELRLPAEIYLEARPADGTVERLELEWLADAGSKPRRMTFVLVGEEPLADDWYHHTTHHTAERAVFDVTGLGPEPK